MKINHSWLAYLLLAVPGFLFAQSSPVFENVTLQQQNGWIYSDVSVQMVDEDTQVLVTRADGATLKVHVGNVAKIVNAQGVDVTLQVIPVSKQMGGSRYNEFSVIDNSGQAASPGFNQMPLPPKLFEVLFSAGFGFGNPIGSFYNDIDPGLIYYADARFAISPLVYIKVAYRNQKMFDGTVEVYDYYNDILYHGDGTLDARQYIVTFGFLNRPQSKNNLRVYGEVGAALVDHVGKVKFNGTTSKENDSNAMMALGGGILIPFNQNLGLDVGATLLLKPFDFDFEDGEGFGMLASCHVGLTASFGGGK